MESDADACRTAILLMIDGATSPYSFWSNFSELKIFSILELANPISMATVILTYLTSKVKLFLLFQHGQISFDKLIGRVVGTVIVEVLAESVIPAV